MDDDLLIRCYADQPHCTDHLAYSKEMAEIVEKYNAQHQNDPVTEGQLFKRLISIRKSGRLICKTTRNTSGT